MPLVDGKFGLCAHMKMCVIVRCVCWRVSWLSANRISGAAVALLSFHLISSALSSLATARPPQSASTSSHLLPCALKCNVNKMGLHFSRAAPVRKFSYIQFLLLQVFFSCLFRVLTVSIYLYLFSPVIILRALCNCATLTSRSQNAALADIKMGNEPKYECLSQVFTSLQIGKKPCPCLPVYVL